MFKAAVRHARIVASMVGLFSLASGLHGGGTPLTTKFVGAFSNPIEIAHVPGDFNRIFVLERSGVIKVVKNGVIQPTPFLNITPQVNVLFERGLLGMDFHPDFASNGYFYIRYNSNPSGQTVIARYSVSPTNSDVAIPLSAQTVLSISNSASNHNGGSIEFGPDGYLYITIGDDANSGNAQDITSQLHGKILRIDVNGDDFPADPARNYAIPPGNPFVGVNGDDEIWAYGVRNPFRAGFDRETGDYWVGDVGAGMWEEIDFQPAAVSAARNYGWPCMEGNHCGSSTACTCNSPSLTLPVWEYDHNFGCAVTGGRVYRGCAIPDLQGTYFCADYCSGRIWSFRYDGTMLTELQERQVELDPPGAQALNNIVAFGEDAWGELYLCDLAGEVFKLVPAVDPPDVNGNGVPDTCEPKSGDANGDGFADINDLFEVITAWGPCPNPPAECSADFDDDGDVDSDDVFTVIVNWT